MPSPGVCQKHDLMRRLICLCALLYSCGQPDEQEPLTCSIGTDGLLRCNVEFSPIFARSAGPVSGLAVAPDAVCFVRADDRTLVCGVLRDHRLEPSASDTAFVIVGDSLDFVDGRFVTTH